MRASLPFLLLLAAACSSPKKADEQPAASASAAALDGDLDLARIRVKGADVFLGSELVISLPAELPSNVDVSRPLRAKLSARRDAWDRAHPDEKFNGRAEIEVAPSTRARAVLSVIGLATVGGFAALTLRSGSATLEVPAWVLRPTFGEVPTVDAPSRTFLVFHADGTVDLKPTECLAPFDTVPSASLMTAVEDWCGEKRDCVGDTFVTSDDAVLFETVLPTLVELRKRSPHMTLGRGLRCGKERLVMPGKESEVPDVREDRGPGWQPPAPAPPRPDTTKRSYVVKEEKVTIGGGPAPAEVVAALHARLDAYEACYEKGLEANPKLAGRVTVVLAIGRKGGVIRVLQKSDLPDEGVIKCVLGAMSLAAIPPLKSKLGVVAPILFSPGK